MDIHVKIHTVISTCRRRRRRRRRVQYGVQVEKAQILRENCGRVEEEEETGRRSLRQGYVMISWMFNTYVEGIRKEVNVRSMRGSVAPNTGVEGIMVYSAFMALTRED